MNSSPYDCIRVHAPTLHEYRHGNTYSLTKCVHRNSGYITYWINSPIDTKCVRQYSGGGGGGGGGARQYSRGGGGGGVPGSILGGGEYWIFYMYVPNEKCCTMCYLAGRVVSANFAH